MSSTAATRVPIASIANRARPPRTSAKYARSPATSRVGVYRKSSRSNGGEGGSPTCGHGLEHGPEDSLEAVRIEGCDDGPSGSDRAAAFGPGRAARDRHAGGATARRAVRVRARRTRPRRPRVLGGRPQAQALRAAPAAPEPRRATPPRSSWSTATTRTGARCGGSELRGPGAWSRMPRKEAPPRSRHSRAKYPQDASDPPPGPIVAIEIETISSWQVATRQVARGPNLRTDRELGLRKDPDAIVTLVATSPRRSRTP